MQKNNTILPEAGDGLPMPRRLQAIAAISFATALVVIDGSIANVALPTIARDLGVENSAAVLVVTVYQLVLVMTLLPFSALGERLGHRTLYQYGLMLFTVATVLCFFARSLPFLLVVRAAQALGAGATLSMSTALVRSTYPAKHLGRGLGIYTVIVASCSALAPTLGGFILAIASWPWVFAAAVPFGLLSLLVGRRALPDPIPRERPYDVQGAVFCASMFGLVVAGIESGVHGSSPVISAAMVLSGLVIARIFVKRELNTPAPMLPIDLLAVPALGLAAVGGLATFTASMTLIVVIPFRLQSEFGLSPSRVGAIFAAWPLTSLVIAPLAGLLSDRISVALLCAVGSTIAIAGMLLFAFLPHDASGFDMAWRLALCGGGFGLFAAPNARSIVGAAPLARVAAAGGLIATIRLLGQTLGATLGAALLALGIGTGKMPGLVAAALMIVAAISAFGRFRFKVRPVPVPDLHDM
jgi:MFS transporter, DHA2 family, multidrug resistance protein